MSEVLLDMAMSLDGFSVDHDGQSLFSIEQLKGTQELEKMKVSTGAVIMDREAYDSANGDLSNFEYQVPIFVLTERIPKDVAKGQNGKLRIRFITDGILHAIKFAKAAARGKNVTITGGIRAAQMAIEAGVVDILKVRLIHAIEGKGVRLFEHLSDQHITLEPIYTEEYKNRTDLCFRLARYKYLSEPALAFSEQRPLLSH